MKLEVSGRVYDVSLQPRLADLQLLKLTTGLGWGTVVERMDRWAGLELIDAADDPEWLEAFQAWIWVMRMRAGEDDLTWFEVGQTPMDEIRFLYDEATAGDGGWPARD